MSDSKDYNDKFINKLRLFLSMSFAVVIYLPVYILIILPAPPEGIFSFFRDIILFIIFLIIGYYFLYNRLWLGRFLSKGTPFYWIFVFYLFVTSLIGALLWGILGIIESVSGEGWFSVTSCGAMLGFIFGLLSSIVVVILKKDERKFHDPKAGATLPSDIYEYQKKIERPKD